MNKIKVCHVVSALESGGVESVIYNYCSKIDREKFEFHILYQRKATQKNRDEFEKIGVFMKEIPGKVKHPLKNYYETKKYLKDNDIDVVHAHMTLVNFIPLLAAKKLGLKLRISHSHNNDVRKKSNVKKFFEKIMKKLTLYYSNIRMACGVDAGQYLYENKDFIVLNNALDLEKYKYDIKKGKILREKYDISSNSFVIGNIGRFTEQKNQIFLLDIFSEINKRFKDSYLLIIGDGDLRENLVKHAKDLNVYDKVIFTGIIDNVNDYYSMMDLFVLPSLWEGLPVVGIEAQASGLKCLFSKNIDKNVCVLENNIKMLPLELEKWVNAIGDEIKLNSNGRIIDNKKFEFRGLSIESEVEKLTKIYLKVGEC